MLSKAEFNPEHQFHVLLHFPDDDRSVAVVPNVPDHSAARFLVVDQGREMGQVQFNERKACVCCKGNMAPAVIRQLEDHIRSRYAKA